MRISELAKKVDMSPDTLRYYEQQGYYSRLIALQQDTGIIRTPI